MNTESFEKYLIDVFNKEYPDVLDDEGSDRFDSWLVRLDTEELVQYADQYGDAKLAKGDTLIKSK